MLDFLDKLFGLRRIFYRLELDGTYCICTADELYDFLLDGGNYKITRVRMTQRQYDRLPEFEGF